MNTIHVITRHNQVQRFDSKQISTRLEELSNREPKLDRINADQITIDTVHKVVRDNVHTYQIDEEIANYLSSKCLEEPQYLQLAARLSIDNHQKNTSRSFIDKMKMAYYHKKDDSPTPLIREDFYKYVERNQDFIERTIDYSRDFLFSYFGFQTFLRIYALKTHTKKFIDRPQDLFMRVAIEIHMNSGEEEFKLIKQTYDYLSLKYFTHASPTCFNSGTYRPQLASCFLMGTEDSEEGIMKTASDMSKISKWSGGIGVHVSCLRSNGSYINGTNGQSRGIVPFLKIYNAVMCAFNQGGRRPGSCAVYLMPHHPDLMDFLDIKREDGDQKMRARDLFQALWIPDIFMERVEQSKVWSFFDSKVCGDLSNLTGTEYTEAYLKLESEKKYTHQLPAREIWKKICEIKTLTGMPYICFSDTANRMSMYKNYGIIKSSNLCSEIYEYSDSKETAVCNLASIGLPAFIENGKFNFEKLSNVVELIVINLNKIIDRNFYPTPETKVSNLNHRPMGIGIQGLADVYLKLRLPFESKEARKLNKMIMETIYYSALSKSTQLAKESGPYKMMKENGGSPISKGIFHWELAGLKKEDLLHNYDWETLREHIKKFGVRNCVMIALMPTASTSQLIGNNECFEPYTRNVYMRSTLAGSFVVINDFLADDLQKMGLWNKEILDYLKVSQGSVQHIEGLSDEFKTLYKTAYEIPQSELVQQAIDRQPFVDQGQSLNLYFTNKTWNSFTAAMFQAWKGGLKTGNYYAHGEAEVNMQNFTVDPDVQKKIDLGKMDQSAIEKDTCLLCGS